MHRSIPVLIALLAVSQAAQPRVIVEAVPAGGIQPQAIVDSRGVLHLLYFSGDPAHGDLFYVRRQPGKQDFSAPLRVNSEAGTAMATGSMRGGQLALGRDGWIHVAWHGAYARLAPSAAAFEPQRTIATHVKGLDGGTIAADGRGNVYVAWHAAGPIDGESNRRVYVATSHDDGAHFDTDVPVIDSGGACGCCGLRALVDTHDRLQILYRAAGDDVHRDATWVSVGPAGPSRPVSLHAWELRACPMTTFAMANDGERVLAAWETQQQIYSATLDPARLTASPAESLSGAGVRHHPSVAVDAAGDRLIAWTEGTAWARGGTLAWELQDRSGKRIAAAANAGAVPVWGLVAAVARTDGSFLILH